METSDEIKLPITAGSVYEVAISDYQCAVILVLSVMSSYYNSNIAHMRYLDHAGVVRSGYFCIDDLRPAVAPAKPLESTAVTLTVSDGKC